MPKFIIDLRKIERSFATLTIEAPNLNAAKRIALDQADTRVALDQAGYEEGEDFWSPDEYDLTATSDDINDNDDVNRMRLGDAAYEAAGASAKPTGQR